MKARSHVVVDTRCPCQDDAQAQRGCVRSPKAVLPTFSLVLVCVIWGSTFLVVKDAVARMPAMDFLAWRFTIAALAMVVIRPRAVRRLDARGRRLGAVLGLVLAVGYITQTIGLEHTPASVSGFITGLYVVFTPLCMAVLLHRPVGRLTWLAVALATAGLGAAVAARVLDRGRRSADPGVRARVRAAHRRAGRVVLVVRRRGTGGGAAGDRGAGVDRHRGPAVAGPATGCRCLGCRAADRARRDGRRLLPADLGAGSALTHPCRSGHDDGTGVRGHLRGRARRRHAERPHRRRCGARPRGHVRGRARRAASRWMRSSRSSSRLRPVSSWYFYFAASEPLLGRVE